MIVSWAYWRDLSVWRDMKALYVAQGMPVPPKPRKKDYLIQP